MNEQLISFKTAKLAKEVGFDWECDSVYDSREFDIKLNYYEGDGSGVTTNSNLLSDYFSYSDNICTAPTQSLLQKWLREKHHLIIIVAYQYEHDSTPYSYWIYKEFQSLPINQWVNDLNTYEEALEMGLQEALKLI